MRADESRYDNMGYKLKAIALLHMLGYNSDVSAESVGAELLFAIGHVLEGAAVEELELRAISKEKLVAEMRVI